MTTPTTELQAINSMLSTIGEAPVNSVESGLVDAETAEIILNEVSRDVQSLGWNFNSEPDRVFAAGVDKKVLLGDDVVRADLAQSKNKYRSSKNSYVQRGKYMYDKRLRTDLIDKDLTLDVVVLLAFTDLPEVARRYITVKASRLFQERVVGSDNLSAMNRQDENYAFAALKEMEGDNGDYNIFDDGGTYSVLDRGIGSRVITNGTSF